MLSIEAFVFEQEMIERREGLLKGILPCGYPKTCICSILKNIRAKNIVAGYFNCY